KYDDLLILNADAYGSGINRNATGSPGKELVFNVSSPAMPYNPSVSTLVTGAGNSSLFLASHVAGGVIGFLPSGACFNSYYYGITNATNFNYITYYSASCYDTSAPFVHVNTTSLTINGIDTTYELLPYYTTNYSISTFSAISPPVSQNTTLPPIVVVQPGGALNLTDAGFLLNKNISVQLTLAGLDKSVTIDGFAMPLYLPAILGIIVVVIAVIIGGDNDFAMIAVFLGIMWIVGILEVYLEVLALAGSLFFVWIELTQRRKKHE
ncbi:MAG: hypothetical protein QXL94_06695, partial [Candidatus Parvarchaeum sp.]